jgi:hypothetical protein
MKFFSTLIAASSLLAVAPSSALAATYYVDPAGSDANPGTSQTAPWQTVNRVNAITLQPGDRVLLKGGAVFNTALAPKGSGNASSPISIESYGAGKAIIDGSGTSSFAGLNLTSGNSYYTISNLEIRNFSNDEENAIYTEGGSNLTFDGLNLHDNYSGLWNSSHGNPTPNVILRNSVVSGLPAKGIDINIGNLGSTGWSITDTDISNTGDSCIIDWGGQDVYQRVTIHHCGYASQSEVPWYRHGIYAKGPNITVKDSKVFDINTSGPGGQCLSMREGGLVENNQLHGCGGGVGFFDYTRAASQTLTIRRNQIWDFKFWGIYLDPVGTNGENPYNVRGHSETFDISNNTVVSTGSAKEVFAFAGAYDGYTANINLANNLFVAAHDGDSALTAWESLGYPGTTHYNGDHNIIWSTSGRAYVKVKGSMSTSPSTIPGETGSTNVDPQMSNAGAASPDFSLENASPAVNYGVTNPEGSQLAPTCDGSVLSYCGSAPDNGALETGVADSPGGSAPTVHITDAPADGASTSASVAWTTTGDVTGTSCQLDGDSRSCSSPTSYSGLSTGRHTFTVTVTNADGSDSDSTSWTIGSGSGSGDTKAPTAPTNLHGTTAITSATLSWTASTDNVGVTGYRVYVDGSLATSVTDTTVTIAGLQARSRHTFKVKAFDAAGNVSKVAASIQLRTHRKGWTAPAGTSLQVSRGAAFLTLKRGVTGLVAVDGQHPTSVKGGRPVRLPKVSPRGWHRVDARQRGTGRKITPVIAFRTQA